MSEHASTAITPNGDGAVIRPITRTRGVRADRPWWRLLLTLPFGCCIHATHRQDECEGTWQRIWEPEPYWEGYVDGYLERFDDEQTFAQRRGPNSQRAQSIRRFEAMERFWEAGEDA